MIFSDTKPLYDNNEISLVNDDREGSDSDN